MHHTNNVKWQTTPDRWKATIKSGKKSEPSEKRKPTNISKQK